MDSCSCACSDRSRSSTPTDRRPVRAVQDAELVAWLSLHRERSTRVGARTALWELDVRDATFANVVSEARRAMARHVEPPPGEEWLGRTLTEVLPLHQEVVTDVDLVARPAGARPPATAGAGHRDAAAGGRADPRHARSPGPGTCGRTPRGSPPTWCCWPPGRRRSWPCRYLTVGNVDGVFWATGQGLKVLPGHEELIALRMRAHAEAGDLSGVRQEWECYERVLNADPWSDGEPAPKLVKLRRQLLSTLARHGRAAAGTSSSGVGGPGGVPSPNGRPPSSLATVRRAPAGRGRARRARCRSG